MSKLGKKIINLPKESSIKIEGNKLIVSGPKGSKELSINENYNNIKRILQKMILNLSGLVNEKMFIMIELPEAMSVSYKFVECLFFVLNLGHQFLKDNT